MANITQGARGEAGFQGNLGYPDGFVNVTYAYDSGFDNKDIFVAARDFVVKSISVRPKVAGTDTGDVSMTVKVCSSGGTDTAGTALHSSTLNLKGTINTPQHATVVSGTTAIINRGEAITLDATGTTTAAKGIVSILLSPA
jgi:hypothetical protein